MEIERLTDAKRNVAHKSHEGKIKPTYCSRRNNFVVNPKGPYALPRLKVWRSRRPLTGKLDWINNPMASIGIRYYSSDHEIREVRELRIRAESLLAENRWPMKEKDFKDGLKECSQLSN